MSDGPVEKLAAIAAIHPNPQELLGPGRQPRQYQTGAIAILNGGRRHQDCHEESEGVHDDVSLATDDLLASVIATLSRP